VASLTAVLRLVYGLLVIVSELFIPAKVLVYHATTYIHTNMHTYIHTYIHTNMHTYIHYEGAIYNMGMQYIQYGKEDRHVTQKART